MPFYRIDIALKVIHPPGADRRISVVRQYKETDIERIWQLLEAKSRNKWSDKLRTFECVQISKRSADYQRYLQTQQGEMGEC